MSWLILTHYYEWKSILYAHFLSFYTMPHFCSRTSFRYHIRFSCHVSLDTAWLWRVLRLSLFSMTLTALTNTGQVFCRMCLNCDLSDAFLTLRLGLQVFGVRHWGEVPFSPPLTKGAHYPREAGDIIKIKSPGEKNFFKGTYYQHDFHHHWRWPWPPSWGDACQVSPLESYSFSPFPACPLWKDVTVCSPPWREQGICSVTLTRRIYIHYLELSRRFVSSPCWFNQLFFASMEARISVSYFGL